MCFGDPIPIGGTQYLFHAFLELLNLSLDAGRKSLAKLVEVLLQVWDLFSPCILVNLAKCRQRMQIAVKMTPIILYIW